MKNTCEELVVIASSEVETWKQVWEIFLTSVSMLVPLVKTLENTCNQGVDTYKELLLWAFHRWWLVVVYFYIWSEHRTDVSIVDLFIYSVMVDAARLLCSSIFVDLDFFIFYLILKGELNPKELVRALHVQYTRVQSKRSQTLSSKSTVPKVQ